MHNPWLLCNFSLLFHPLNLLLTAWLRLIGKCNKVGLFYPRVQCSSGRRRHLQYFLVMKLIKYLVDTITQAPATQRSSSLLGKLLQLLHTMGPGHRPMYLRHRKRPRHRQPHLRRLIMILNAKDRLPCLLYRATWATPLLTIWPVIRSSPHL